MIGMNKYVSIIIVILIVSLSVSSYILYNKNKILKEDLSISVSNEKEFIAENSSLEDKNSVFKFTVEQLNYYNNSILEKMNEVRKELKIKDFNNTEVFPAVNPPQYSLTHT